MPEPNVSVIRHPAVRAVALAVAMVLALAGCGSSGGSATATSSASTAVAATTTAAVATSAAVTSAAAPSSSAKPAPASTAKATGVTAPKGMKTIAEADLPKEAKATLALIDKGGPFPYRQDGVVFENREGRLPSKPSGYYHEYTVVTPGSSDRGTRRLVQGAKKELYYTDDHYATFRFVVRS